MKLFVAFLLSCVLASAHAQDACADKGYYWFVSAEALGKLITENEKAVKSIFDSCKAVVRRGNDFDIRARKRMIYHSYREFEEKVRAGAIQRDVSIVVYNPERGLAGTLEEDKADPVGNGRRFAELARRQGLLSLAAPSCRLLRTPKEPFDKFMACGERLLAPLAAHFDFIDVQAQAFQSDPAAYRQIVGNAVRHAKRTNPRVRVLAQVTTADGYKGNTEVIARAIESVASEVDGYWLNFESTPQGLEDARGLLRGPLRRLNERGLASVR